MKTYNYTSSKEPKQKNKIKALWKRLQKYPLFTWLFRIAVAGFLLVALLFVYYSFTLPDPNKLLSRNVPESTKIFDREGNLLYEIHGEFKRTLVELDQISPHVKNATVAVEDKDFYKHAGISLRGVARSVVVDIFSGSRSQGGSTITQQFVKNAVLTREKKFSRKIKEIILSLEIDARFSKDEILKLYLNEIPYGRNAYGIEAAAETYFGKSAKDLSIAESAYLAALPQAPTYYNPLGPNREALDGRARTIMRLMKEQGYINEAEYEQALSEKLEFNQIKTAIIAPHFVLYVQDFLAAKYGEKTLEEGGLKVYTTLDPRLQKIAEDAVRTGGERNASRYGAHNASLVATDPKTGQILAMVGSRDYFGESYPEGCTPGSDCLFEPNFNAATGPRQPGSSFKPYAYVTAFKKEFKYSPASMLVDVTTDFGRFGNKNYVPHNYNGQNYGPVSMRQALAGSLNIPAVKTIALVGPDNVVQTARDLGITSPMRDCGLSLVLGGCEVKLVDHVSAYGVIANGGRKHEKTPIVKIEDQHGEVLEEYTEQSEQVLDPQAVYELTSIMTDTQARLFTFGSAASNLVVPGKTIAVKTGTTNEWKDGWTVGFTPSLAAGVWVGNNSGKLMNRNADGSVVAAPIWKNFMAEALKDLPNEQFTEPAGIKRVTVDAVSGKLPTEYTPDVKTEIFADYAVPTQHDDVHVPIKVDSLTGLPATELTPPDQTSIRVYRVLHSEKPNDPNWENPVVTWARANGYIYPTDSGSTLPPGEFNDNLLVDIIQPQEGATISTLPFQVSVSASSSSGIARIDLFLDGQFIESKTAEPFIFSVNKKLPDGQHTLAVHAVDTQGYSTDTTTRVLFTTDQPLNLTEPLENSSISGPITLAAHSGSILPVVGFYYQDGKLNRLIGSTTATPVPSGGYLYTVEWGNAPPGKQTVFARDNNGNTSQKVTFVVK